MVLMGIFVGSVLVLSRAVFIVGAFWRFYFFATVCMDHVKLAEDVYGNSPSFAAFFVGI